MKWVTKVTNSWLCIAITPAKQKIPFTVLCSHPRGVYCLCVWLLSFLSSFLCGWLWFWRSACLRFLIRSLGSPEPWQMFSLRQCKSPDWLKLFFFLSFHLCCFCSFKQQPLSLWLTEKWQINTCVQRLCLVVDVSLICLVWFAAVEFVCTLLSHFKIMIVKMFIKPSFWYFL